MGGAERTVLEVARWLLRIGAAVLTILTPAALQISVQASPREAAMACEIDGASAANSIAQQAIQAAKRRGSAFMTMFALYQRPAPPRVTVQSLMSKRGKTRMVDTGTRRKTAYFTISKAARPATVGSSNGSTLSKTPATTGQHRAGTGNPENPNITVKNTSHPFF